MVKNLNVLSCKNWSWCKQSSIWLTASFIPGVEDVIADNKSMVFDDNTEWYLQPNVFQNIADVFRMRNIDLFASSLN